MLPRHFAEVDDSLSGSVNAEHRLGAGLLITLLVVVRNDELIVMLPPREHITPMAQVIGNDRKTVAPRLDDGFDVMERPRTRLQQALVDLRRFLKLNDLNK